MRGPQPIICLAIVAASNIWSFTTVGDPLNFLAACFCSAAISTYSLRP